jgi:lipopolysaccharide exporter
MTEQGSILARTAKGAGWVIAWRMFTRILGLISTIFLVKLLLPEDFGLVMLATGFSSAVSSLSVLGVEDAVIRERSPSRDLYDSAFTLNVIRGFASAIVIAAGAWPAGLFFGDMRLVPILLALSIGTMIGGFENIGIVEFRRNITFEKEFQLMSVPRLVSVVTTVSVAYLMHSYWALVVGILVSGVLRVMLSYWLHPFRPRFGLRAWRSLAGFAFWSWAIGILYLIRARGDSFVIGRLMGTTEVGLFSLGAEISDMPASELAAPLSRASFSAFSATQHGDGLDGPGHTYLRVVSSGMMIALPASIGLSLVADPVVRIFLGLRWVEAIPVIEILGIALSVTIIGYISASLLTAHALLKRIFHIQLGSAAIRMLLLIPLVWHYGLIGGAVGSGITAICEHMAYVAYVKHHLRLRWLQLLAHVWRSLAAAGVMALGLFLLGLGWHAAPDIQGAKTMLAIAVPTGAAIYVLALIILWRLEGCPDGAELDMITMLTRLLRRSSAGAGG